LDKKGKGVRERKEEKKWEKVNKRRENVMHTTAMMKLYDCHKAHTCKRVFYFSLSLSSLFLYHDFMFVVQNCKEKVFIVPYDRHDHSFPNVLLLLHQLSIFIYF